MLNADNIYLVGPMGSGKSAVGRQLAQRLGLEFVDSDAEIEARTGVDIACIFDREGEAGFRARERDVIDQLTRQSRLLVATGGGAVLDADTRERLRSRGCVVYLRTSVDQQLARTRRGTHRPLLEPDPQALQRSCSAGLYKRRPDRRYRWAQGQDRRRRDRATSRGGADHLMHRLRIELGERSYPILIGPGLLMIRRRRGGGGVTSWWSLTKPSRRRT
jgi:shikimate kinase